MKSIHPYSHSLFSLIVLAGLLFVSACDSSGAAEDPPDPPKDNTPGLQAPKGLGTVELVGSPIACEGRTCYNLVVSCPNVAAPASVTLGVTSARGTLKGTVLFMTGGSGGGYWGKTYGTDSQRAIDELNDNGYQTIEVDWNDGWLIGTSIDEGQANLACRPATVAHWIFEESGLHDKSGTGFCATGNSGGSAQVSYMLSHYGLEDILDLVIPTEGPPMGRIDLGCNRSDESLKSLRYSSSAAGLMDRGFGIESNGPCATGDLSFSDEFLKASVVNDDGDYFYPNTRVHILFGARGAKQAQEQALTYYDRLIEDGSPLVSRTSVANTPHDLPSTAEGASMVQDLILNECKPQ